MAGRHLPANEEYPDLLFFPDRLRRIGSGLQWGATVDSYLRHRASLPGPLRWKSASWNAEVRMPATPERVPQKPQAHAQRLFR